jgi:hypothetical protein
MTLANFISSAIILTFVFLFAGSASAQYSIPIPSRPQPQPQACPGVPSVYIRNIRHDDYSKLSKLSTTTVAPGGFIRISTRCLKYDGQVVVTIQDANRPTNGYGVTAFRLTNVRYGPDGVTAQMPDHPIFRNRTYHIALFVYGQTAKTANPGYVTIR